MTFISRYIYSNCTNLVVGCTLYSNYEMTAVYANKQIKIVSGGIAKVYSTMVSGVIVSVSDCYFTSTSEYNTYSPIYTGSRTNCGDGGTGSTITVNDGGAYSFSGYTSPVVSYISQADANDQARTLAIANFNAGIQAYINSNTSCSWAYYSGSATYPATSYTRNNCGANCDASSITYPAVSKSGYAATSVISYADAVAQANNAAYEAARNESISLGQAYANTYGTCCCWIDTPDCSGCNRRGNRQINQCTGAERYADITEYSSCLCGVGCKGTYYGNWYCDGDNKVFYETYNCGGNTGNTSTEVCGCNDRITNRQLTGYTTCIGCTNTPIYKDINQCSSTPNHYFVNGEDRGLELPSTTLCFTGTDYSAYKGIRCLGGSNYDVYEDTNNSCSGAAKYQYRYADGSVYTYTNDFGSSPCTFSTTRTLNFQRSNCGSGYVGGIVSYTNTYYYSGLQNQAGADSLADANFSTDGQNYANSVGSCTAIPTCYTYSIISNNSDVYVSGTYTTCGGVAGASFSYYSYSAFSLMGTICAQAGTVNVVENGFANAGSTC